MPSPSASPSGNPGEPTARRDGREQPPKVLFVGRSSGHFSYFESVLAGLLNRQADVELLLDKHWSHKWIIGFDQTAMNEFSESHPGFTFEWLQRRSDRHRKAIFALRELRAYRSYLVRKETTPFYVKRWHDYLTPQWKARLTKPGADKLLRSPIGGGALLAAEVMTPPDPGIIKLLKGKRPDLVIICPMNLRYSEETDYAKAARKLGIPVAVVTISWDNLSTKGLFHVVPDKLFVWNEYQRQDAVDIQGIPNHRISVSGSPFFDKWFERAGGQLPRAEFCSAIGFDPDRPILLYLGSSKNIAKNEAWFVQTVHDRLKRSSDPRLNRFQILVRPHPANAEIYKVINETDVRVWPEGGALPETRQDFADMRNSFFHAKAVLGINTSGMIDAVLADLPTFSVRLSRYAQTQSNSKHFKYLEQADALYLCDDIDQFWTDLANVSGGHDPKAAQRREFARLFARPQGLERSAGDVIAEQALKLIQRLQAA